MVGSQGIEQSAAEEDLFSQSVHERDNQHQRRRPRIGLGENVVKGSGDEREVSAHQISGQEAQECDDAERQCGERQWPAGRIGLLRVGMGPEIRDPKIQVPATKNPMTKKLVDPDGTRSVAASKVVPTTSVTTTVIRLRRSEDSRCQRVREPPRGAYARARDGKSIG